MKRNTRYTLEEVREIFESRGMALLSTEYLNNTQPLNYVCSCGSLGLITVKRVLKGQRCKRCGYNFRKERTFDFNYVRDYFLSNGCVLTSTTYKDSRTHLDYICSCGLSSKITFHRFRLGQRCRYCGTRRYAGPNHYNWNPKLTNETRVLRRDTQENKDWSISVKFKDKFTCVMCGDRRGGNLVSHHLDGYDWCIERRLDPENGVTLCTDCHKDFHLTYGYGGNTREQFEEWCRGKETRKAEEVRRVGS